MLLLLNNYIEEQRNAYVEKKSFVKEYKDLYELKTGSNE